MCQAAVRLDYMIPSTSSEFRASQQSVTAILQDDLTLLTSSCFLQDAKGQGFAFKPELNMQDIIAGASALLVSLPPHQSICTHAHTCLWELRYTQCVIQGKVMVGLVQCQLSNPARCYRSNLAALGKHCKMTNSCSVPLLYGCAVTFPSLARLLTWVSSLLASGFSRTKAHREKGLEEARTPRSFLNRAGQASTCCPH